MTKPNCLACKHYFVTWDPRKPKGCRRYQIKSDLMPSQVIKHASGSDCMGFEPKAKKKSKTLDLNSDDLW